jgi:hypothetical protein
MINKIAVVFLTLSVIAGCAMLAKQDARLELATQYATLKVIAETEVTAEQVQERVQAVRRIIETDAQVTVRNMAQQVRQSIGWDSLDVADQLLLDAVLMEAESKLAEIVGDGVLDDQGKVAVGVLLDWIVDATAIVGG